MTAKQKGEELISRYGNKTDAKNYAGGRLADYLIYPEKFTIGYYRYWNEIINFLNNN